jgi:hypothetical protein
LISEVIDMKKKMRVMTEKPLNAETPIESLRTWTTFGETKPDLDP